MLKKSSPTNGEIIACLHNAYGLETAAITRLSLGADSNTVVYRVDVQPETGYFLKLRSGVFLKASVLIPDYLSASGLKCVIPPLRTLEGQLWVKLNSFTAALYPYKEGQDGVALALSETQWIEWGKALKKLHSMNIPPALAQRVPKEIFSLKGLESVKTFLEQSQNQDYEDPISAKMARFLNFKNKEIQKLIEYTKELALLLKKQPLEYILCHADIHGWNLFIDKKSQLYIVDWDTVIFAPKERDLMFIGAGIWDSGYSPTEEEWLFYKGYGHTEINQNAIAYYRFERVLQDISEYCKHIFLSGARDEERMRSFESVRSNFCTPGTLERAYQAYKTKK